MNPALHASLAAFTGILAITLMITASINDDIHQGIIGLINAVVSAFNIYIFTDKKN